LGRIRFVFLQKVIRKSDQKIMAEAKNIGVCIDVSTGRPVLSGELKEKI
jgi:acyl-CoA thioesterase FadM